MILKKWNYDKHIYEPYEVPEEWIIKIYSENMDEIINCLHCGKEVKYGETYTSHEVHTEIGLGYPVCEKCYAKENERWYKAHKNEV